VWSRTDDLCTVLAVQYGGPVGIKQSFTLKTACWLKPCKVSWAGQHVEEMIDLLTVECDFSILYVVFCVLVLFHYEKVYHHLFVLTTEASHLNQ